MSAAAQALLADIGGTNARFALLHADGRLEPLDRQAVAAHPAPAAAIRAALAGRTAPARAVLAVAAPVHRPPVTLTNAGWRFDPDDLAAATGIGRIELVNDFEAQAWALSALAGDDLAPLGGGPGRPGAARVVLGPGTGLGVATWLPPASTGGAPRVLAGEGGHAALAAEDGRDAALLARLRPRFGGRVSAERVLSGPGLLALADAVAAEDGHPGPEWAAPADLVAAARAGHPLAAETVTRFAAFLASFAGDLALIAGAWDGVYLAGGIPGQIPEFLTERAFRGRFEAKGRFRVELEPVPAWRVVRPDPAFLGLAERVQRTP
jgi:glucokinase